MRTAQHSAKLIVQLFALSALFAVAPPVAAATLTVGASSDPNCDFNTLADAVAAAAAHPFADTIRIADNQPYFAVSLDLTGQSLVLAGGYADCGSTFPTGKTVLDGNGSFLSPVITIGDMGKHSYAFQDLDIQNSSVAGVSIAGEHTVSLAFTDIRKHQDRGITMIDGASGFGSTLFVDKNSAITQNGGGIACTGSGYIQIHGSIMGNLAPAGGGIRLEGCGMDVFPGSFIAGNDATLGGGIYADAGSQVFLSGGTRRWNRIMESNWATIDGGHLYISGGASVRAEDVAFVSGDAFGFGAFAMVTGEGSKLNLDMTPACSRAGDPFEWCSRIYYNGQLSDPLSVITVEEGGQAQILRTVLDENAAFDALGTVGTEGSLLRLESSLIVYSSTTALMAPYNGGELVVEHVTAASNWVAHFIKSSADGHATMISSIVSGDVGGASLLSANVECLLTDSIGTLPPGAAPGPSIVEGVNPQFVDPWSFEFDLVSTSPAIDFCDGTVVTLTGPDLNGNPRPVDQPTVPNTPLGPFDLGAFERP